MAKNWTHDHQTETRVISDDEAVIITYEQDVDANKQRRSSRGRWHAVIFGTRIEEWADSKADVLDAIMERIRRRRDIRALREWCERQKVAQEVGIMVDEAKKKPV